MKHFNPLSYKSLKPVSQSPQVKLLGDETFCKDTIRSHEVCCGPNLHRDIDKIVKHTSMYQIHSHIIRDVMNMTP